ncbi:pseudouridine synthase [Marinomonas sp. 2405UD68-3]|uniref:pseudouridine synthase n=1 Tax=Marinomonas sp. 2405UD68-3 TaxID=3391835 RepID=UPI0039C934E7
MMELTILFQDDYIIAINKPEGLLVHRTHLDKHEEDAVVQRLRDQIGQWVFPVHRLDRATSGVLILALSPVIARVLGSQFENHEISKTYHALVRGHLSLTGHIDYPLARIDEIKGSARIKVAGTEKAAETAYKTLSTFTLPMPVSRYPEARCSLVEVTPFQGRKHQIRRHFKHIFHPLIGDTRYGCRHYNALFKHGALPKRMFLHALNITFSHPVGGQTMTVHAPYSDSFSETLLWLKYQGSD